MNLALRQPLMTREQFFQWAQAQDARYEFDGFQPVALAGANLTRRDPRRAPRTREGHRLPAAGSGRDQRIASYSAAIAFFGGVCTTGASSGAPND